MSARFPQFLQDEPQWDEGYGVFGFHQDMFSPIQHVLLNVLPDEHIASLEIEATTNSLNWVSWETTGDEPTPDHQFCVIAPTPNNPLSKLFLVEFVPIKDISGRNDYRKLARETLGVCGGIMTDCPIKDYFAKLAAESTHIGIWERVVAS